MSGQLCAQIEIHGIDRMRIAKALAQERRLLGHHHQMNMVGYQAIGPNRQCPLLTVLLQEPQIRFPVAVRLENIHTTVPALRHMMRKYRNYNTRHFAHRPVITSIKEIYKSYVVCPQNFANRPIFMTTNAHGA